MNLTDLKLSNHTALDYTHQTKERPMTKPNKANKPHISAESLTAIISAAYGPKPWYRFTEATGQAASKATLIKKNGVKNDLARRVVSILLPVLENRRDEISKAIKTLKRYEKAWNAAGE